MTKEELTERLDEVRKEIRGLERAESELKRLMVKEHCPYKVGQKCIRQSRGGKSDVLVCNYIAYDNSLHDFIYHFKMLKKDGTLSVNRAYVYGDEHTIEWLDEFVECNLKMGIWR